MQKSNFSCQIIKKEHQPIISVQIIYLESKIFDLTVDLLQEIVIENSTLKNIEDFLSHFITIFMYSGYLCLLLTRGWSGTFKCNKSTKKKKNFKGANAFSQHYANTYNF